MYFQVNGLTLLATVESLALMYLATVQALAVSGLTWKHIFITSVQA